MPRDKTIKPIKIDEKDVAANKISKTSKPGVRNLISLMQISLTQHAANPITKIRHRHQRAAEIFHLQPKVADIPVSMVRRNALNSIPWWGANEVMHEDNQDNPVDLGRPDGANLIDEKKFKIKLLDGREVFQIRRLLISKTGKRFKEFDVEFSNGKKANFNSIPNRLLPLYGINNQLLDRDKYIIICEGAKACDALVKDQIPAVGTLTGALGTPSIEALEPLLKKGKDIYLWPDNDDVGVQHMARIAKRLNDLGVQNIRVIRWRNAPRKADAADFKDNKEALRKLMSEAQIWEGRQASKHRGMLSTKSAAFSLQIRLSDDERPSTPRIK